MYSIWALIQFQSKQKTRYIYTFFIYTINRTEYTTYAIVTEYLYPIELSIILEGKAPLTSLINWGPALGFLPHQDALVFIDSHETQRHLPKEMGNNKVLTYKSRNKYIMANAFMLLHPYGQIKKVMSSYQFGNNNQGPPTEEEDADVIASPRFDNNAQCSSDSGWICEHRWPALVNVLQVANYFSLPQNKEDSVVNFQTNGPNQIAFCRGHKAFIAMNNDPVADFEMLVYTCLEHGAGVYCDVITGGKKPDAEECQGRTLLVADNGYAQLMLPPVANREMLAEQEGSSDEAKEMEEDVVENFGILIVYLDSKLKGKVNDEAAAGSANDGAKNMANKESTNIKALAETEADKVSSIENNNDANKSEAEKSNEIESDADNEVENEEEDSENVEDLKENPNEDLAGNTEDNKNKSAENNEEENENVKEENRNSEEAANAKKDKEGTSGPTDEKINENMGDKLKNVDADNEKEANEKNEAAETI